MTRDPLHGRAGAVLRSSRTGGAGGRRPPAPGLSRFAGYASPAQLVADGTLTREEKASGLETWRETALHGVPGDGTDRLIVEIDRALRELGSR